MMDNKPLVSVDFSDLKRLQKAFKASPEIASKDLQTWMTGAVAYLQGEVQKRTPTSHGTMRASIIGNVRRLDNGVGVEGVIGSSLGYMAPLEMGTKPHMPPVAPIEDWVQQKLGLKDKEARRAAWGIALRIARFGTPAAGMFHRAWNENRDQVQTKLTACLAGIMKKVKAANVGRS